MPRLISQIKRYSPYTIPILSLSFLVVLINATNPLEVGPAGILLVFGVVYIFATSTLYLLLTLVLMVLAYFVSISGASKKKLYYLANILGLAPVFLLALNSIGQLEIKDFVLVLLLVGIASFYVLKRTS